MIVLDFNGIAFGSLHATGKPDQLEESMFRHMVLNTIRMYNLRYREEYGQMVICCDWGSWRKTVFPEYKASRGTNREKDTVDWDKVFKMVNTVRDEIRQYLCYPVVHVEGVEADDIIAVLAKYDNPESTNMFAREKVMIVSADKDFIQLHSSSVQQFSPLTKKLVKDKDTVRYLYEHIFKGDAGDGVPNILSPDDTFKSGNRQKPVTKKFMDSLYDEWLVKGDEAIPETHRRNYDRNNTCVNLDKIPSDIQETILEEYTKQVKKAKMNKGRLLTYLTTRRASGLIECASDFAPGK